MLSKGEGCTYFTKDPELCAACEQLVLPLFSDVDLLAGDIDRTVQGRAWVDMPFSALQIWAASDKLFTASENYIVYVLQHFHFWDNEMSSWDWPVSDMQPLAALVRVRHLSPAYLHFVLHEADWFKPKEPLQRLVSAMQDTAATGVPFEEALARKGGSEGIPAAWLDPAPRPSASPTACDLDLSISREQLQEAVVEVLSTDVEYEETKDLLYQESWGWDDLGMESPCVIYMYVVHSVGQCHACACNVCWHSCRHGASFSHAALVPTCVSSSHAFIRDPMTRVAHDTCC